MMHHAAYIRVAFNAAGAHAPASNTAMLTRDLCIMQKLGVPFDQLQLDLAISAEGDASQELLLNIYNYLHNSDFRWAAAAGMHW
jgi:hypothetical protein